METLIVPKLRGDVLSVSQIVKKGGKVLFDDAGVDIQLDGQSIHGQLKNNLFTVNSKDLEMVHRLSED